MPRIRTIKPEFPQSQSMGSVSRDSRLLFILLWTLADDSGRLRGNSRMLASLLFPYDDDVPRLIDGWLLELEGQDCIVRYVADDGAAYLQICKWLDHQKIDKASVSKLPEPTDEGIREFSRMLSNPLERSRPSRARADQGSRIKEGIKDQGSVPGKECCNEVATQPSLPPSEPVDLTKCKYPEFPCARGKSSSAVTWTATAEMIERFSDSFPGISLEIEMRKAHAWVMANITRRKTASGMEDFLRRWLTKAQDRSAGTGGLVTIASQRLANTQQAIMEFTNGE